MIRLKTYSKLQERPEMLPPCRLIHPLRSEGSHTSRQTMCVNFLSSRVVSVRNLLVKTHPHRQSYDVYLSLTLRPGKSLPLEQNRDDHQKQGPRCCHQPSSTVFPKWLNATKRVACPSFRYVSSTVYAVIRSGQMFLHLLFAVYL